MSALTWHPTKLWRSEAIDCEFMRSFTLRVEPWEGGWKAAVIGGSCAEYRSKRVFATIDDAKAEAVRQGIKAARRLSREYARAADALRAATEAQ